MRSDLTLFECLPPPMSQEDRAVLQIISGHRKDNPIPRLEVAAMSGLTGREVQKAVRRLIMDYGKNIGSSCNNKKPGYYMNDGLRQTQESCEKLTKRALKVLARVAKQKKIGLREYLDQLDLNLLTAEE